MYGACALPMIDEKDLFSSMTMTTWSGTGRAAGAAPDTRATSPIHAAARNPGVFTSNSLYPVLMRLMKGRYDP